MFLLRDSLANRSPAHFEAGLTFRAESLSALRHNAVSIVYNGMSREARTRPLIKNNSDLADMSILTFWLRDWALSDLPY